MINPSYIITLFITCLAFANISQAQEYPVKSEADAVELFAQKYYQHMQDLDYDAMRAMSTPELEVVSMSTPEFEIFGEGLRIGHKEFEAQINAAKAAGRSMLIQAMEFKTVVTPSVAYTSYLIYLVKEDKQGIGQMVLKRSGDKWVLDHLTHTSFMPGYPSRKHGYNP